MKIKSTVFDMDSIIESHFEKSYSCTIQQLINDKIKLDTNPLYQRGLAWTKQMNIDFIAHLVSGAKSTPITLVRKDGKKYNNYFVLDGKQRVDCAVYGFVNGSFEIQIILDDGSIKSLTFDQINKKSEAGDSKCSQFLDRFLNASLDINLYKSMSIQLQSELFKRINQSKPLNNTEKIIGENYITKKLYEFIFNTIKPELGRFLSESERNDKRSNGLRFIMELLFLQYGSTFTDTFSAKPMGYKKLKVSTMNTQKFLENCCGWNASSYIDEEELRKHSLNEMYDNIKDASRYLNVVLSKHPLNQCITLTKVDMLDVFNYFICMVRSGVFTYTFCEFHSEKMLKAIVNYTNWKKSKEHGIDMKSHTDSADMIQKRMDGITKLFDELGLDMKKKNQRPTEEDKRSAIYNSNGKCGITGMELGPEIELDHITPKCISSNKSVVPSTPSGNRTKGNKILPTVTTENEFITSV